MRRNLGVYISMFPDVGGFWGLTGDKQGWSYALFLKRDL